jgi:hypothetical protein
MRKFGIIVGLLAASVLAPGVAASPPSHFTFTIDETVPAPGLSAACGFEVVAHLEGSAIAIVFYDQSGEIVREIDTNPSFTTTFFAPSQGTSFTYAIGGILQTTYTEGAAVGSSALAKVTGVLAGTGSTAPNAGTLVFEAVVIDITPEGIPIIDLLTLLSATGHRVDSLTEARCATLTA